MALRLILNGGKPDDPALREAVHHLRKRGHDVDVRVTWEDFDAARLAREACLLGIERVVAGGGDGTLNGVVNGLMAVPEEDRATLGVLPFGTANDFATACGIPAEVDAALDLAANGPPVLVDVGRANDHHFLNAASGGFGAEVTAATPSELKRLLGSGAYALMAAIMAVNAKPREGRVLMPGSDLEVAEIFSVCANGRQAGGGKKVAPHALLDDGLLDVLLVRRFPLTDFDQVYRELGELTSDGEYVSYHQTPWIELHGDQPIPVNLDGEPHTFDNCRLEVVPKALSLVLPAGCPLLTASADQPPSGPR